MEAQGMSLANLAQQVTGVDAGDLRMVTGKVVERDLAGVVLNLELESCSQVGVLSGCG